MVGEKNNHNIVREREIQETGSEVKSHFYFLGPGANARS